MAMTTKTNKGEKMIQSKVQMDGFEQTLNCLYDPSNQYWNGFANPYFDQTNFDKWVAWLKQEESDTYDEVKDMPSEIINGKKYYYCGGAYTWSYVEKKYDIDDLFGTVNDIYSQWDEGQISDNQTYKILIKSCKQFIKDNEKGE